MGQFYGAINGLGDIQDLRRNQCFESPVGEDVLCDDCCDARSRLFRGEMPIFLMAGKCVTIPFFRSRI